MTEGITRCPKCGTAFRVTSAQLALAAGAVRCGACLHVFEAQRHWLEAPPPPTVASTADLDNIDGDAPLFADDMPWDEADDAEDGDEDRDGGGLHISGRFLELEDWEEEPRSIFRELDDIAPELRDGNEEAWAEALLREMERDDAGTAPRPRHPRGHGSDVLASVPEIDDIPPTSSRTTSPVASPTESLVPGQETATVPPLPALRAEPDAAPERVRRPALPDIEEPLELTGAPRRQRAGLLYALGCVLAGLLLAGQWLAYNLDSLARGSARPLLESGCRWLGCQLPALQDLALIRVSNLMVREHPQHADALAVDIILSNQAAFAQAWPALELRFSNLEGEPVAARRFQPGEYLAGELSGARDMPSRQPVHIALELVSPGEQAVNYSLHTVAASP